MSGQELDGAYTSMTCDVKFQVLLVSSMTRDSGAHVVPVSCRTRDIKSHVVLFVGFLCKQMSFSLKRHVSG